MKQYTPLGHRFILENIKKYKQFSSYDLKLAVFERSTDSRRHYETNAWYRSFIDYGKPFMRIVEQWGRNIV